VCEIRRTQKNHLTANADGDELRPSIRVNKLFLRVGRRREMTMTSAARNGGLSLGELYSSCGSELLRLDRFVEPALEPPARSLVSGTSGHLGRAHLSPILPACDSPTWSDGSVCINNYSARRRRRRRRRV